jgi:hypothetical protein
MQISQSFLFQLHYDADLLLCSTGHCHASLSLGGVLPGSSCLPSPMDPAEALKNSTITH